MAGLIPQAFIDDLLSRVDIVDVIDRRIKLRKTGKNYSALCPFHSEKTPSFSVEPEKQFYYCFGCGAAGNALGFVMHHDRVDFPQAVENLAASSGLTVPREGLSPEQSQAAARREAENKALYSILEQASRYFQQQLRRHPARGQAVDYLKSRGLTGEVARQFGIGFAPPGWDNLLKHFAGRGVETEVLVKSGLLLEREQPHPQHGRHYDRFRERIIFPIRDSRGRVIAFGGRVLGNDTPKYLNSPETAVYHKGRELYGLYEARKARGQLSRALIVEGYMDVVALAQHGISYAMATLGTATSEAHLTRLFRLVPEVVFCFDGDEAGRRAAWRALENTLPLMQDDRQVRFLFLPEGEDPDSLVRRVGQQAFSEEIDQADHLSEFFFDGLSRGLDLASIDGRAKLGSKALPLIRRFPAGIYPRLMLQRLSELTGMDQAALEELSGQGADASATDSQSAGQQAKGATFSASPEQADQFSPEMPPGPPDDYHLASGADRPGNSGYGPQGQSSAQGNRRPAASGPTIVKPSNAKPAAARKSPALQAIELLLYRPAVAADLDADLAPLQHLKGEDVQLLLELIELVRQSPNTTTYTMLGHCYGTAMGSQLTRLMKNEKITPKEGVQEEFLYLIKAMLAEARKKQFKMELLERLRPRVRSGKPESS